MKTLKIDLPEELVELLGSTKRMEREAKEALVLDLVRKQKISQGKGAELLGMSTWDFQELMTEHNIPMVDLSSEELSEGSKNLRKTSGRLKK